MGGFSANTNNSPSGSDVVFASNADFSGQANPASTILTNGQLWIGSTALNIGNTHINVGQITSSDASINVGYISPNINLTLGGGAAGKTITGDSGGALSPTLGNWNLLGSGSITTSGAGSTLTTQLTGLTNHALLVGAGTTTITKVGPTATAGQYLQSGGAVADPVFSTATLPSTATGTGKVLVADGTNWVASTPTFPNASATSGKIIQSDGTNWLASTPTYPTIAGTSGKILISDGTNIISSTPTYPNSATGTGTILRADGTNWVATTSTYPNTNAVSTLLYASAANVMSALATANSAILATNSSGVPSITTASGNWLNTTRASFLAYMNTAVTNVTGDGTVYTIIYDTEVFDQGSDFNLGTSTFTAPVTGKYHFNLQVLLSGGTTITSGQIRFVVAGTSAATYNRTIDTVAAGTTSVSGSLNITLPMTATDTITFQVLATDGGGKVDDVAGVSGALRRNFVSGYLVC